MEIIYRGEIPPEPVYRGTCSHCRSVVQATIAELRAVNVGLNEIDYVATCPVCQQNITFSMVKHEESVSGVSKSVCKRRVSGVMGQ